MRCQCGAELGAGWRFCRSCGADTSSLPGAPSTEARPEEWRPSRQVHLRMMEQARAQAQRDEAESRTGPSADLAPTHALHGGR